MRRPGRVVSVRQYGFGPVTRRRLAVRPAEGIRFPRSFLMIRPQFLPDGFCRGLDTCYRRISLSLNFFWCDIPARVVRNGNIFYLCYTSGTTPEADILDESVFRFCPYVKMWKFSNVRGQRTALISCLDHGSDATNAPCPISIQVWGIASFILTGSFHNLHIGKRNSAPHFPFFT